MVCKNDIFFNMVSNFFIDFKYFSKGIFKDTLLGRILKPIVDNRGCREKQFYEFIFHGPLRDNPCIRTLRSFLPFYHTTISLHDIQFIVLEDVSSCNDSGFSLMDVKLGKCAYDRHASIEKIKADGNKSKLSKTYGFRILGIKVSKYHFFLN